MTTDNPLDTLRRLRADLGTGVVTIEEVAEAFERLVWSLPGTTRTDERELSDRVNDIETIRFTLLPENQTRAIDKVLRAAEPVIARCAER